MTVASEYSSEVNGNGHVASRHGQLAGCQTGGLPETRLVYRDWSTRKPQGMVNSESGSELLNTGVISKGVFGPDAGFEREAVVFSGSWEWGYELY
ncbi:MAG: hypothetical protein ACO3FE_00230 [Planctomycetaceae bacterium]